MGFQSYPVPGTCSVEQADCFTLWIYGPSNAKILWPIDICILESWHVSMSSWYGPRPRGMVVAMTPRFHVLAVHPKRKWHWIHCPIIFDESTWTYPKWWKPTKHSLTKRNCSNIGQPAADSQRFIGLARPILGGPFTRMYLRVVWPELYQYWRDRMPVVDT